MKTVWYIGKINDYNNKEWEIQGVFLTKDEAIKNTLDGEFCAIIDVGMRGPEGVVYPREAYWNLYGKILEAPSNENYIEST